LPAQFDLFAKSAPKSAPETAPAPPGFAYWPEVISGEDEAALIARFAELPLAPFQFGAFEGKRRVASFGFRYDYTDHRLHQAAAMPAWVAPLASRVETHAGLASGAIAHVLFTEYAVGTGIGWHRDKASFDLVFGLSLASACPFRFRRREGKRYSRVTIQAEPRSLYRMSGEARHIWEHSIAPVAAVRYSITFRTLAAG